MLLTSTLFLAFMSISVIAYYLVHTEHRWKVLLVASIIFYCSYNPRSIVFIFISSFSVYLATTIIDKGIYNKKKKRSIVVLTMLLNFGILGFFKYIGLFQELFFGGKDLYVSIISPLGISFYTFQIVGYLLDVYWGREKAEKNYFKVLLFAIFFPQIIQGPISRHRDVSVYLNNGNKYDFLNIKYGIQLIIWGFFKKIVIADTIATAANEVLHNPGKHSGVTVIFGILAYSAELYMDFSGGIDVIRGCSQCFGINLVDNFKRPFFSKSIQEFWHRWHITLGTWMKDYLFYPMALSKSMNKLSKTCQRRFGRIYGRKIPICIENIIVFLVVGIWHGPSLHFVVYGLYNGLIIAISTMLEPTYDRIYIALRLNKEMIGVRIFRIIRTFILVNIGWFFDDVNSLKDSATLIKQAFISNVTFYNGVTYLGLFKYQYAYVGVGLLIVFIVSIMQEKGIEVRKKIDTLPYVVKMGLWIMLIFMIPIMGWDPTAASAFMYASF